VAKERIAALPLLRPGRIARAAPGLGASLLTKRRPLA